MCPNFAHIPTFPTTILRTLPPDASSSRSSRCLFHLAPSSIKRCLSVSIYLCFSRAVFFYSSCANHHCHISKWHLSIPPFSCQYYRLLWRSERPYSAPKGNQDRQWPIYQSMDALDALYQFLVLLANSSIYGNLVGTWGAGFH